MIENVPEILKDCGRLLALGLNKNNIQTQVNSDPKAVNLTISLNEDFHLKIVQNLQQVLNGEYVYIPDEKEFVWTKEILQENDANTDRVMQATASKITCKFCQLSIDNPKEYSVHLEKHLSEQRKHLCLGGAKLGDDPDKNGIHCLLCSFVTTDLTKFQSHNKDCQVKVSTGMDLVKSGKLNSEANGNISQDTKPVGSLSCDKCHKIFKLNMALSRHKRLSCTPREEKPVQTVTKVSNKIPERNLELLNYPGEVAKALFKCLRCALPFQLLEEQRNHVCSLEYKPGGDADQTMPNLLKCQICPNFPDMKFSSKDNLRMHYTVAHYQHWFLSQAIKVDEKMREKKGLELKKKIFPMKCRKNGCEEQISDSRQLAIHTAIEHKKLKKALMTAKLFENEQVKNEVIKLLVEGDESLTTSDNSFQDQSKTESNSGQKSKTTANLLDTPAPEKATAPPVKLPPTKVAAPKKASVKTSKAPAASSTSNAPTKVRVVKVVSEIRCPKCEEVFSSIEIMRLHTCDSIMDIRDRKEGQDRDRQATNRFGLGNTNLKPEDVNTSFSTNATNSTYEDQENVSLSKVKKRRRSGQQQPKNDKSANKKTRLEDKKKFLVDSSSDESNSDGDIDTSHPEETIENIEKLVKDTPKAKPKKPVKAVPAKSQNVAKNVQQESKKVKDTPETQQNKEKYVPKKSQENNVNGAKEKQNDHDNFSDEEEDSDEDVITCKGCNKQFKTYLDYVHKDHMKVSTPCWKEYCKQDD